jgi:hypothetical protein
MLVTGEGARGAMRARLWVQRKRTLRDYAALCQDQEAPFGINGERVTGDRGVGVFATRAGNGGETGAMVGDADENLLMEKGRLQRLGRGGEKREETKSCDRARIDQGIEGTMTGVPFRNTQPHRPSLNGPSKPSDSPASVSPVACLSLSLSALFLRQVAKCPCTA